MAKARGKAPEISYADLRKRAAAGALTDREIETYFEIDEKAGTPFRPVVKLDRAYVKVEGKAPPREEVNDLLAEAERARKAKARTREVVLSARTRLPVDVREKLAAAAASRRVKTRILAEGDSWFDLPPVIKPKDAMDFLDETHDIENVAKWGDTLQNMVARKQYVQKLSAGTFGFFFFSGGGNDVLDSIGRYVSRRNPGDTDPGNAPGYVKATFRTKVRDILSSYRTVISEVKAIPAADNVTMFVHGYANAIPLKGKASLGRPLEQLGFDPSTVGPLGRAIVAHMVGMFNEGLRDLAASQSRIVYIDLRGIVRDQDWHSDEIHPSASGARRIATEFARRVAEATPTV